MIKYLKKVLISHIKFDTTKIKGALSNLSYHGDVETVETEEGNLNLKSSASILPDSSNLDL